MEILLVLQNHKCKENYKSKNNLRKMYLNQKTCYQNLTI